MFYFQLEKARLCEKRFYPTKAIYRLNFLSKERFRNGCLTYAFYCKAQTLDCEMRLSICGFQLNQRVDFVFVAEHFSSIQIT